MNKIKGIKYIIRMHGGHHFFAKAENRPTEWKKVWQEKRSFKNADAILNIDIVFFFDSIKLEVESRKFVASENLLLYTK